MGRTNNKEEDSIMNDRRSYQSASRFSTRYYDGKFEIMEDGGMVAQFDTFEDMHQWIEETVEECLRDAAFHSSEAVMAGEFAESLTEMVRVEATQDHATLKFFVDVDGHALDA